MRFANVHTIRKISEGCENGVFQHNMPQAEFQVIVQTILNGLTTSVEP